MIENIEFEIEARLDDASILEPFISKMKFIENIDQVDIYYDTLNKDLFKQAVFLRNRNDKILEIKSAIDPEDISHLECKETVFKLPLTNENEINFTEFIKTFTPIKNDGDFLSQFNLHEFVVIKKHRKKYANDDYELVIDNVEGLGDFFEIELKNGSKKELLNFVKDNKIERLPLGYVELYLRKNDFETYKTGRFLLNKDRK